MTLWSEIQEQPAALRGLLDARGRAIDAAARAFRGSDVRYAVVAARGTSDNAARYAQYLWGARNRLNVALATPSLFTAYSSPPSLDGAAVIGISQSGRSPDVVAVLEEARAQGRPTVAITNDAASPLASAAEAVVDLEAGPEHAVAATKTYTAELAAIAMLSASLADDAAMWSELDRVPERIAGTLARSEPIREVAEAFAGLERCVVLGRGYHLSTAFEWALKLQELCLIAAQPFSTVDFEHGPIAMADDRSPLFAVASPGPLAREIADVLERLGSERGARSVVIAPPETDVPGRRIDLDADIEEWASPIAAIVVAQLFTAHLCVARGLDPDAPRGLRKITRTW